MFYNVFNNRDKYNAICVLNIVNMLSTCLWNGPKLLTEVGGDCNRRGVYVLLLTEGGTVLDEVYMSCY